MMIIKFQVCADEKESRKDLYIKATSYSGQLKARKSQMLKEHDFHLTTKKGAAPSATGDAATSIPVSGSPASVSNIKSESDESKSRSASREKSLTKSDREKSPDRIARKSRDRDSKEKSDRSSKVTTSDRHEYMLTLQS